jgi:transketolase
LALRIRLRAVRMVAPQGLGYLGQALSSAEEFAALYGAVVRPDVDQVVCSPGHYIIAAFAAAAEVGLLGEDALASYGRDGSALEAIGSERSPVVTVTFGSLGQGLSAAVGFALANRLGGDRDARTFVLVSDGELEEGQLWEAAMFARHHRLGRITVLLDANNSQVDGPVDTITTIEPIAAKWESFGWHTADISGHDVRAVERELRKAGDRDVPTVIICRTSTRHGLDCLPPDADGHFIKLPAGLAERAVAELESKLDAPHA